MRSIPEWVWAPLSAAFLTAIVGATGLRAGLPWLFPSLGPTIFLQVQKPDQRSAHSYIVVMGHAIGIIAAVIGVLAVGQEALRLSCHPMS